VEIGASLVAGAEPFELVQPGEGALDDPAHLAESGTVGDAASRDQGFDAALAQQAAVLVEVVAPVGVQTPGFAAGRPRSPRIGGMASSRGRSWVTSCRLPPLSVAASGVP
jgi:hypothetical protein